jgi:hypothetical protein
MSAEDTMIANSLRVVVFGRDDTRLRATWRVFLAMALLWILTGAVLAGTLQSAIGVLPSGQSLGSGLAQSVLHGGFLLIALVTWARFVDRYPLSNYGVSISLGWVRDGCFGFAAVLLSAGVWTGLTSVLSDTTVVIAPSVPQGSVLLELGLPFVALGLHAAVQQIVFFRIILKTAAEGLHSRGVSAVYATVAAIPVAVLFFILMHGSMTPLRVLDLAVAGGIFGLLYLHTGELGLGIGAHFGALYSSIVVSAVMQVNGSPSGILGVLDQYGFPTMMIAYIVIIWLLWGQDEFSIQSDIARRSDD